MNLPRLLLSACLTLAFAVVSVAMVAPGESEAAYLCQKKKNGNLKLRDDVCKEGKEKTVGEVATQTEVDGLVAQVATNTAGIGTNVSGIAGSSSGIAGNSSDIAAIEAILPDLVVEHNYAEGGSVNDFDGSNESILTLDVTTQVDGFLMVWANVDAEHDNSSLGSSNKGLSCRIAIDGSIRSISVDEQYNGDSSTVADGALAVAGVGAVTAGDHAIDILCTKSGTDFIFINNSSLMSLFVTMEGDVPPPG